MIPFARVTTLLLTIALALAIAVPMHWWPRLSAGRRRRLTIATSLAGLGFLVAALRTEGLRESALTSLVLVGPATLTARASASASLYYYVLTAFCLGLGFTGLIFSDSAARWLKPRPLLTSVAVAWLVTVARFLLEKSAAPSLLIEAAGVTWLAPIAGAYLALALRPERATALVPVLARYAFLVRGLVVLHALPGEIIAVSLFGKAQAGNDGSNGIDEVDFTSVSYTSGTLTVVPAGGGIYNVAAGQTVTVAGSYTQRLGGGVVVGSTPFSVTATVSSGQCLEINSSLSCGFDFGSGGIFQLGIGTVPQNRRFLHTFNVIAAPEPGTLVMLGVGVAGIALRRRSR